MNLSQARFSRRTGGNRPGAPVCNPGQAPNGARIGMLGASSDLYKSVKQRQQDRQNQTIALRQRQYNRRVYQTNRPRESVDRIARLESKLEQIEQQYAISTSGIELKVDNTSKKIDLINGEYRQQMKIMREYIKQLEEKLKKIDEQGSKEVTKDVNPPSALGFVSDIIQENITLEISEN